MAHPSNQAKLCPFSKANHLNSENQIHPVFLLLHGLVNNVYYKKDVA